MPAQLFPPAVRSDGTVALVDKARLLLAQAKDAGQAKLVADMARAAEVYARRQQLGNEAIDYARAIVIDAMTLMGEMLKASPKNHGENGQLKGRTSSGGAKREPPESRTPTLADYGIGKRQSSDAQFLDTLKKKGSALHAQIRDGKITVKDARVETKRQEKRNDLQASEPPDADTSARRFLLGSAEVIEEMIRDGAGHILSETKRMGRGLKGFDHATTVRLLEQFIELGEQIASEFRSGAA